MQTMPFIYSTYLLYAKLHCAANFTRFLQAAEGKTFQWTQNMTGSKTEPQHFREITAFS